MRPFFSYYGAKNRSARHFGPPRRDLVIEPFAGSAGYSVYWTAPRVRLYDLNEEAVAAWDWLINCSEDDVRAIPDKFYSNEEWWALPHGPRRVVDWNIHFGLPHRLTKLQGWYLTLMNTGERTGRLIKQPDARFWDRSVKERIIANKKFIREWTIELLDYRDIPIGDDAHYFVDPPYQGPPERHYTHHKIDYPELAEWCRSLPGAVDVCENEGADWLPFQPLFSQSTIRGEKKSAEVVWRNDIVDLLDVIRHSEGSADG